MVGAVRICPMRHTNLMLVAAIATITTASPALAGSPFYELTEAQKRKSVVPDIEALTYCVARVTLADPDGAVQYRAGLLASYVARQLQRCPAEMNALLSLYESTYGDGEAERFIQGPYTADLPRAVLSVIRPQLDAKVEAAKRSEQAAYADELARQSEADRRLTEERAATVRAEAETKATEAKAAMEKQGRVDTVMRSMAVLRDKFYECADRQLPGLMKSGESADVLASAAMTICGKPLPDVQDAALEVSKAREETAGSVGEAVMREQVKTLVKERVVADAVQAKAGLGAFADVSR